MNAPTQKIHDEMLAAVNSGQYDYVNVDGDIVATDGHGLVTLTPKEKLQQMAQPPPIEEHDSGCHGLWGCVGHGLKKAGQWAWEHRGMIATIGATVGCFVPAVGWAACAGLQALAFAVRTQATIQYEGGWEQNKNGIMLDGFLTAATVGLAAPIRLARFNTLRGIAGAPLLPLPRFISPRTAAAMAQFQTQAWNDLGWRAGTFGLISWTVPAFTARHEDAVVRILG